MEEKPIIERDKGIVYIIKNGKIRKINISPQIPQDDIKENRLDRIYYDEQELDFISHFLETDTNIIKRLSPEMAYAFLVDSGYTVIRSYVKTRIADNYLENYALIGKNVSEEDIEIIKKIWTSVSGPDKMGYNSIFNRVEYSYGNGYEAKRKVSINNTPNKMNDVLDIFLRDKIGKTTPEEKEMLRLYRDFELKRLLTSQEDVSIYPINNDNSGIYIITPDDVVKVTVRNKLHQWQARDAFANLYYDQFTQLGDKLSLSEEAEKYNSIIIQISSTVGVPIIPWFPRKINTFQYKEAIKFCDELIKIKQETNLDFDYIQFFDVNGKEQEVGAKELKDMVERHQTSLIDDNIHMNKSYFVTRKDVTDGELDEFFGIEENTLVAKQVRKEIEGRGNFSPKKGENFFKQNGDTINR